MDRNQVIEGLKGIAYKLSKKYNCSILYESEDRQKGIWGKRMTEFLEEKYGECTHEFKLVSKQIVSIKEYDGKITETPKTSIKFRYRFSNPCLIIKHYENSRLILAEMEISNWNAEQSTHTGDNWHIAQFTILEIEGMKYANVLKNEWDKFVKETKIKDNN